MNYNNKFKTGIYIRLSKEDGDKAESDSVANQKMMLVNYVNDSNEFEVHDIYIDDGYTGTNFDRPSFKKLINDIEDDLIDCVIVKDLSRLGRDYIESGSYIERYFPSKNVRFIAVNDNVDSLNQQYDMLMPIRNIFNEQYSRDISKKVQSAFKAKQKDGQFIGAFAPYGYKKNPHDRHKLIIDEYAATIIRRIFDMYNSGIGKVKIAKILNNEKILCPTEYKNNNGEKYFNSNRNKTTSYWTYSSIHKMLKSEVYIGNMVQGKTNRKMKKNPVLLPEDKWIVVKNTHEPIIDIDTWNTTKNLLKRNTRQLNFQQNVSIFAGFLKCGDCGRALSKTRWGDDCLYYSCASYKRYGLKICTSHLIQHKDLEYIILKDLNAIIQNVKNISNRILQHDKLNRNSQSFKNIEKETQTFKIQLEKIQKLKKGIYEDYKEDILTKEEFIAYKNDYIQQEQVLNDKIETLSNIKNENNNDNIINNEWIQTLLKYKKIKKLDRETIVKMIYMIYVYENRKIKIVYNFSNELETLLYCADNHNSLSHS